MHLLCKQAPLPPMLPSHLIIISLSLPPPIAVEYSTVIPFDAPPSYRGDSVNYSYKVTVGTQRLGGAAELLRVPFRVFNITSQLESARRRGSVAFESSRGSSASIASTGWMHELGRGILCAALCVLRFFCRGLEPWTNPSFSPLLQRAGPTRRPN